MIETKTRCTIHNLNPSPRYLCSQKKGYWQGRKNT